MQAGTPGTGYRDGMGTTFDPRPTTLAGTLVHLEPLAWGHAPDLLAAGSDDDTWRYMPRPALKTLAETEELIEHAVRDAADGSQVPFAIIDNDSKRAIGSTRLLDIQRHDRGLEIGWTWIGAQWRRTGVNTECKWLLLSHSFDELGARRVALKTDARNKRSRVAIERIGGKYEGTLRKHRLCWDGSLRDTVYYSILDDEWPEIRSRVFRAPVQQQSH